jgi:hypothetical protein
MSMMRRRLRISTRPVVHRTGQRMEQRILSLIAVCLLVFNACSGVPSLPGSAAANESVEQPGVMKYYSWLRSLDDEQLFMEKLQLEAAYEADPGLIDGVRLSLLLTLSGAPTREELLRAHRVLDELSESESINLSRRERTEFDIEDYQIFAELWRNALSQYLALVKMAEMRTDQNDVLLTQNMRLERAVEEARNMTQQLEKDVAQMKDENKSLQLQLDALKAIEQQMNQRELQQELP